MFEWSDARIFLAVCSTGTFTAAAKALALDQTTVGRRIAALEAVLNAKLFRRGPAGLRLTHAGEEAKSFAEQMEGAAQGLEHRVQGRDRAPQGVVRLTTIETLGRALIAPSLADFHRRYPSIELAIKTDSRSLSLTRGEADVALRLWKPSQEGLVARRIGRVAFAPYASSAYVSRRGAAPSGQAFLGFDDELAKMPDEKWLRQQPHAHFVLRSNSRAVLENAAAAGTGIAFLMCFAADRRGDLIRIGEAPAMVRELWIVVHEELQRQERVRVLLDFLAEVARENAGALLGDRPRIPGFTE
jgi:DNA-binding transcriptional LysR family regulator